MPTDAHAASTPASPLDALALLRERFGDAARAAFPGTALPEPVVAASANAKFGDFQCNSAMAYAKVLGQPPRQVALALVEHVKLDDLAEPLGPASVAGPGFLNITLKPAWIERALTTLAVPAAQLGLTPDATMPRTVVDLCGVNLAKQMHIGHLRATVIGDTIARVLERLGGPDRVIRQNHVGDWGLPIAMVTAKLLALEAAGEVNLAAITIDQLDAIYKRAKGECDANVGAIRAAAAWGMGPKVIAELEEAAHDPLVALTHAKATLVRLQSGDAGVRRVWQRIYDVTMAACIENCARLNSIVKPRHSAGESSYEAKLAPLVARLEASGVAELSAGALIVRLDELGIAEPCIVRKSDGGFIYATTDLAAIEHRVRTLGAGRVVYCVDARQALHFRQVFAAAHKAGIVPAEVSLEHAAFGTILGEDGRPFKSRSGESVRLGEVIDEAVARADAQVLARNPQMPDAQRAEVAKAVAIAAIRYTDLASERVKDYVFSLERMVKFEGDTGPYLLYALARVGSILRNAAEPASGAPSPHAAALAAALAPGGSFMITEPGEKALAMALLRYPQAVREVARTLEPHRLCACLYELAGAFSGFFESCPVLKAPSEQAKSARLRLCVLTQRVMTDGLGLLGIPTVERM